MKKAYEILQICNQYILTFCKYGVIISTMGVFFTVIIGVFFRYVLNNALVWSEEMSRFCMLWMAFLGTPLVTYRGGHVAIELILSRSSGFLKTTFIILIQFIIFFVLILLVWVGTILSIRSIPQHSTAVPWLSFIYFYLPMPIGALLMLPTSLEIFIKQQFIETDSGQLFQEKDQ